MPSDTEAFRFTFTLSDEEIVDNIQVVHGPRLDHNCQALQQERRWALSVAIAMGILTAVWIVTGFIAPELAENVPYVLRVGVVAAAVASIWMADRLARQIAAISAPGFWRSAAAGDVGVMHRMVQRWTVDAEGVRVDRQHGASLDRWSGHDRLVESPQSILFISRDGTFGALPKRVFETDEERTRFLTQARTWIEQYGPTPDDKQREYLADQHVPCTACGHDLHKVEGDRCPECGQEILPRPEPSRP